MGHLPEHGGRPDSLVLHRQLGRRGLLPVRHHHHDHHQDSSKVKYHFICFTLILCFFPFKWRCNDVFWTNSCQHDLHCSNSFTCAERLIMFLCVIKKMRNFQFQISFETHISEQAKLIVNWLIYTLHQEGATYGPRRAIFLAWKELFWLQCGPRAEIVAHPCFISSIGIEKFFRSNRV